MILDLLFVIFQLRGSNSLQYPLATRSLGLEDYRYGVRLDEDSFKIQTQTSQLDCTKMCLKNVECISINYCQGLFCGLKRSDVFTEGAALIKDPNCQYMGMKKTEMPLCQEEGSQKAEEPSPNSNLCDLGLKTKSSVWSEWSHVVDTDDAIEWKKVERRECLSESNGVPCDG